jgi:hypothetical protein
VNKIAMGPWEDRGIRDVKECEKLKGADGDDDRETSLDLLTRSARIGGKSGAWDCLALVARRKRRGCCEVKPRNRSLDTSAPVACK